MNKEVKVGTIHGDALDALEGADQSAHAAPIMPVSVVWDYDLTRGGQYGGLFLATDKGQGERYCVPDAPQEPESLKRQTSWDHSFPGFHLPSRTMFAVVATQRLFEVEEEDEFNRGQKKKVWRFEAVAVASDIIDLETGNPALVKLTIRGTAANKLYDYMVRHFPEKRLTAAIHQLAEESFKAGSITKEKLAFFKKQRATRQMLWMPVETAYGVRLGRNRMQVGASPFTDRPNESRKSDKEPEFISRWDEITDEELSTGADKGGLLLDREMRKFCKQNRLYWEEQLANFIVARYQPSEHATSAKDEGVNGVSNGPKRLPDETGEERNSAQESESAADDSENHQLAHDIRQGLKAVGLKETDPQVIARMAEFGSNNIDAMSAVQMRSFFDYVRAYANRKATSTKNIAARSSLAA
jgi:hypothetical protein